MGIRVSVKIDNAKINKLIEAHKKALEMTADAVLSDIRISQVVPKFIKDTYSKFFKMLSKGLIH